MCGSALSIVYSGVNAPLCPYGGATGGGIRSSSGGATSDDGRDDALLVVEFCTDITGGCRS